MATSSIMAQQDEVDRVQLRVSGTGSGSSVMVDRGTRDGVQKGDVVVFYPRQGGTHRGSVTQVRERTAVVEMRDPSFVPPMGTRGEVLIPKDRTDDPEPEVKQPEKQEPEVAVDDEEKTKPEPEAQVKPTVVPDQEDPQAAPEPLKDRRIDLTVTEMGPGAFVVVDHGKQSGLWMGDPVVFAKPDGGSIRGEVILLDEESGVVELLDSNARLSIGTQGQVEIPGGRANRPSDEVGEGGRLEEKPETEEPKTEPYRRWTNRDEEWKPGMPLLSGLKPVHPEEREMQVTGRIFVIADLAFQSADDDWKNSYFRGGADLTYENPFGKGGGLNLFAELDYLTKSDNHTEFDFLLQRASYSRGGTRFADTRWEAGRFLQYGMPEFGVLDGFEWDRRRDNGDRFGASIGFMPELDEDFDTGADFQVAGFYEWVVDEAEQLTLGGGFQATWHHGDQDRDLLVAKADYVPPEGWDFHGTLWVDFYTSKDDEKNSWIELTMAYLTTGRRWPSGNGLDVTFRHQRFPETLRDEFFPGTIELLANSRYERLSINGWRYLSSDKRLHGEIGGWDDNDDSGGDGFIGLEVNEFLMARDRFDLVGFATVGQYETDVGGRFTYGRTEPTGGWQIFYEIANHQQHDFSSNIDDILQQRFRVSRDFFWSSGWSLTLHAGGNDWEDDWSASVGFYLQKTF